MRSRSRLVPGLEGPEGGFLVPARRGWQFVNPLAETIRIRAVDCATGYKASHLIRMAEAWRRHAAVPLEPLALEILATDFVAEWAFRYGDAFFYDWMARDFFAWLCRRRGDTFAVPGRARPEPLGRRWAFHAERARRSADRACRAERARDYGAAAATWREIFGPAFAVIRGGREAG